MKTDHIECRPILKSRGFSNQHINIFEMILLGRSNREINKIYGYTQRSHAVVDHSRKVMHKLLAYEGLFKKECRQQFTYPRRHQFWWNKLLNKHYQQLTERAINAEYYHDLLIPAYSSFDDKAR